MFDGARVLVTGVTGNIGWGVARGFIAAGATVIGLVRRQQDADALADSLGSRDVVPVIGDLATGEGARAAAAALAAAGGADHAVMALGGWWQGGVLRNQQAEDFVGVRAGILDAQVNAATAILPALSGARGSSYTVITGAGAMFPVPDAGFTVIAAAGVRAVSMMLRAEEAAGPVRVNEIMIRTRIEREARPGVHPADDFGRFAVERIAQGGRGEVIEFPAEG